MSSKQRALLGKHLAATMQAASRNGASVSLPVARSHLPLNAFEVAAVEEEAARHNDEARAADAASRAAGALGKPEYQLLTETTRPPLGEERNPVYKWHNDYVAVRQHGRRQMQVRFCPAPARHVTKRCTDPP